MSRIAIVLRRLGQGGTERVAVLLANGFAATGHEVDLLLLSPGEPGAAPLRGLLDPAVRTIVTGRRRRGRLRELTGGLPGLVSALRRTRPDVLLSSGNNVNGVTALAHRLAGGDTRLAVKITNPLLRPHDGWRKKRTRTWLYRFIFARADAILTLSRADSDAITALFPRATPKTRAVANPYVRSDALPPPRRKSSRLLAIGRLVPQKNMALLLRAIAHPAAPPIALTILGEGPERPHLENLIRHLGLDDRVEMLGYILDPAARLRDARLLVLPSAYEGLPAVVIEAMAAGVPVVATACFPAAVELLNDVPGCVLVPPNDPAALAQGIADALGRAPDVNALCRAASPYDHANAVREHLLAMRLPTAFCSGAPPV